MPLRAASVALRQRRSVSVDHWSGTLQDSPTTTPNTRKRQHINYTNLDNSRATTPTPNIPSARPLVPTPRRSPRRQAPLAQQVV